MQETEDYYRMVEAEVNVNESGEPALTWKDVCGLEDVITALKEHTSQTFGEHRQNKRHMLMYGFPGTGKSLLLKVTACEQKMKLFVFNLYHLQGRVIGGAERSERCVRTVFSVARNNSPCILCLEDLDVLEHDGDQYRLGKMTLETELEKYQENKGVVVVGVTQRPWLLDSGTRRRFSFRHVGLLSVQGRRDLLKDLLQKHSHSLQETDLDKVTQETDGFTGADIVCLVRDAEMCKVRAAAKAKHFKKVLVPKEGSGCAKANDKIEETSNDQSGATTSKEELSDAVFGGLKEISDRKQVKENMFDWAEKFTPCEKEDVGAIEMSLLDIPGDQIHIYPEVCRDSMTTALLNARSSISTGHMEKMEEFHRGIS